MCPFIQALFVYAWLRVHNPTFTFCKNVRVTKILLLIDLLLPFASSCYNIIHNSQLVFHCSGWGYVANYWNDNFLYEFVHTNSIVNLVKL